MKYSIFSFTHKVLLNFIHNSFYLAVGQESIQVFYWLRRFQGRRREARRTYGCNYLLARQTTHFLCPKYSGHTPCKMIEKYKIFLSLSQKKDIFQVFTIYLHLLLVAGMFVGLAWKLLHSTTCFLDWKLFDNLSEERQNNSNSWDEVKLHVNSNIP